MDEAIVVLSEALGPKWTNLFYRLGIGDYRGRFQIQSKWNQKEPIDTVARHSKCSLEVLQKWRLSVQGRDERESLEQLLNAVNEVKGLQRIANDLAQRNGIELRPAPVIIGSETSSDEADSLSLELLAMRTVIQLENTTHKFAILDISQRLNYDKFVVFSKALELSDDLIKAIRETDDLHEEQFYYALKQWIQNTGSATFNQLIKCLKACNEAHLIPFLSKRLHNSAK